MTSSFFGSRQCLARRRLVLILVSGALLARNKKRKRRWSQKSQNNDTNSDVSHHKGKYMQGVFGLLSKLGVLH